VPSRPVRLNLVQRLRPELPLLVGLRPRGAVIVAPFAQEDIYGAIFYIFVIKRQRL